MHTEKPANSRRHLFRHEPGADWLRETILLINLTTNKLWLLRGKERPRKDTCQETVDENCETSLMSLSAAIQRKRKHFSMEGRSVRDELGRFAKQSITEGVERHEYTERLFNALRGRKFKFRTLDTRRERAFFGMALRLLRSIQ